MTEEEIKELRKEIHALASTRISEAYRDARKVIYEKRRAAFASDIEPVNVLIETLQIDEDSKKILKSAVDARENELDRVFEADLAVVRKQYDEQEDIEYRAFAYGSLANTAIVEAMVTVMELRIAKARDEAYDQMLEDDQDNS